MYRTALLVAACAALCPAFALTEGEMFSKHWKTTAEFTLAVAEAMPADSYNFRPNDEEMGFGKLMAHIAMANNNAFQAVSGVKAPAVPEKISAAYKANGNLDKADVMQFLKNSFDYCTRALEDVTTEKLDQLTGPEGRQLTGRERLWSYFTHTAHHRGQAEVYLRVKNIKPPSYRF